MVWASAESGWSRIAVRNSATASSSFPWPRRASPRLTWVRASSGRSRIAVAVLGDGLVQLPLAAQGEAEVGVGRGVVGLQPDRLAQCRDGRLRSPRRPRRRPRDPSGAGRSRSVPGARRAAADQVREHRHRLVAAAPASPAGGPARAPSPGRGRAPPCSSAIASSARGGFIASSHRRQVIVEPDVARVVPLGAAEQADGRLGSSASSRARPRRSGSPAARSRGSACFASVEQRPLAAPWGRRWDQGRAGGRGWCRGRRRGRRRSAGRQPALVLGPGRAAPTRPVVQRRGQGLRHARRPGPDPAPRRPPGPARRCRARPRGRRPRRPRRWPSRRGRRPWPSGCRPGDGATSRRASAASAACRTSSRRACTSPASIGPSTIGPSRSAARSARRRRPPATSPGRPSGPPRLVAQSVDARADASSSRARLRLPLLEVHRRPAAADGHQRQHRGGQRQRQLAPLPLLLGPRLGLRPRAARPRGAAPARRPGRP